MWIVTWITAAWNTLAATAWPVPTLPPIGQALRAFLIADTAVAGLVSTRIYPLRLPQKAVLPAIVLTRISGTRGHHLRGPQSLTRTRYQVDCWARTHDEATALGTLCQSRLDGFTGTWTLNVSPAVPTRVTVLFDTEQDFFEEEINGGLCRHSADYFLYHHTLVTAA